MTVLQRIAYLKFVLHLGGASPSPGGIEAHVCACVYVRVRCVSVRVCACVIVCTCVRARVHVCALCVHSHQHHHQQLPQLKLMMQILRFPQHPRRLPDRAGALGMLMGHVERDAPKDLLLPRKGRLILLSRPFAINAAGSTPN